MKEKQYTTLANGVTIYINTLIDEKDIVCSPETYKFILKLLKEVEEKRQRKPT